MATDDRARLEAQAEGGQAGLAAFDQAKTEISNRRSESIAQAMAESANRGAGAAADQAIQAIISRPVDRRLNDITQAAATFDADMARLANAQQTYMAGARQFGSRAAAQEAERAAAERRQRALEDALFNRYGGYDSATEYENAVQAGALGMQDQIIGEQSQRLDDSTRRANSASNQQANAGAASRYLQSINRLGAEGRSQNRAATKAKGEQASKASAAPAATRYVASLLNRAAQGGRPGQMPSIPERAQPAAVPTLTGSAQPARDREILERLAAIRSSQSLAQRINDNQLAMLDSSNQLAQVQAPGGLNNLMIDYAINELGADPLDAIGRFGLTPNELAEAQMDQAQLDQQLAEFQQYGQGGQEQFFSDLVAQRTGGFDLGQLSTATNLTPDAVAGAVASPEFDQIFTAGISGDADPVALVEETAQADPIMAVILEELFASLFPEQFG